MKTSRLTICGLAAFGMLALAGCGGAASQEGGGSVNVVASTTQVGDFVRSVGGDEIEEHQILQPNSDPHDYEPRPEDVRETAGADLVFMSGDDLDSWVEDVVSESGGEPTVVDLATNLPDKLPGEGHSHDHGDEEHSEDEHSHEHGDEEHSDEEHSHEHGDEEHSHESGEHSDEGHSHEGEEEHSHEGEEHSDEGEHSEEGGHSHDSEYDPHWWHDPHNAEAAVAEIRDALIEVDPDNEQTYRQNAEDYIAQVQTLDEEIEACVAQVPEDERKLVTDHDAFNYFTNRYDIEVVGAVIPSQTTQAQPSARDTAELIETIEAENVQAIFPESSINPRLAQRISEETGATAEYTLYGDALGPEGSDGDTYLKMEAANANAMVQGFTGGEESCDISAAN